MRFFVVMKRPANAGLDQGEMEWQSKFCTEKILGRQFCAA
jgi:hypothetical protein